ncbi:TRAP transporter substrate-binding protein DctP [Bordetella genomosp. 6]|uniref:ABC transporter substrate-binding protein n=1 Tax=Bordetella genomosp. 6 TaxID=463024 RepID=A0ABX4FCG5_9BORD|nr:TRAP transporter substrate-binding protein DctP [Bordetella genomosp. 6]OZI78504.1 ABC transporter substrate-binding protein [Bordetella genomosp. 6]
MNKTWIAKLLPAALLALSANAGAADKPIELTLSTYAPPSYEYMWKPLETFIEYVEKESQGRVKIKAFHSAQLFDGYEELPALSRGDIDITTVVSTYASGAMPVLNLFTMPFVFQDTAHLERAAKAGLLDVSIRGEMRDKHGIEVLGLAPIDPYQIYSRRAPVRTAADFKGKVWATTGAADARAIQLLGGSPTSMPSSELYLALDRGVVDGTPRPLITGLGRSLHEVVKHLSLATLAIDTSLLSMNKAKFDSLPPDIQDIIRRGAQVRDDEQFRQVYAYIEQGVAKFEKNGVSVYTIEPAALQDMRAATRPAVEEWVAQEPAASLHLDLLEKTRAN